MLGDSVIQALEEQERNKHKKKQREKLVYAQFLIRLVYN